MQNENSGSADHSVIFVPEDGKITISLKNEGSVSFSAKQLRAFMWLLRSNNPKSILDSLRKGFMEISMYKFLSDAPSDDQLELDKDFVIDFNAVCCFFEEWSKELVNN